MNGSPPVFYRTSSPLRQLPTKDESAPVIPCIDYFIDVFLLSFLLYIFFLLSGASLANDNMCGVNKYGVAQDKIVGGQEAKPNQYPWLVSLWYNEDYYIFVHTSV